MRPQRAQQLALPGTTVHVSQALDALQQLPLQVACTVCHELKSCKQAVSSLPDEALN